MGRVTISGKVWDKIYSIMINTEYKVNGGIKLSTTDMDLEILEIRQMWIDDGNDIETLT